MRVIPAPSWYHTTFWIPIPRLALKPEFHWRACTVILHRECEYERSAENLEDTTSTTPVVVTAANLLCDTGLYRTILIQLSRRRCVRLSDKYNGRQDAAHDRKLENFKRGSLSENFHSSGMTTRGILAIVTSTL